MNNSNCITCHLVIDEHQRAVTCDRCTRWNHVTCGTGISIERYARMLEGVVIQWVCLPCIVIQSGRSAQDMGDFTITEDTREPRVSNTIRQHIEEPVRGYHFYSGSSRKGTRMLVDARGYIYSKKYDNKTHTTHWRCKYNNPPTKCLAKLKQISETEPVTMQPCPKHNPHTHICLLENR